MVSAKGSAVAIIYFDLHGLQVMSHPFTSNDKHMSNPILSCPEHGAAAAPRWLLQYPAHPNQLMPSSGEKRTFVSFPLGKENSPAMGLLDSVVALKMEHN